MSWTTSHQRELSDRAIDTALCLTGKVDYATCPEQEAMDEAYLRRLARAINYLCSREERQPARPIAPRHRGPAAAVYDRQVRRFW